MTDPTFIVYTAITGEYDPLREPPNIVRGNAKFVAFRDVPCASDVWEIRPFPNIQQDPVRTAKMPKVLAHEVFPEAEYSLWVDGSVEFRPTAPLSDLLRFLNDADIAVFEHPHRHCAYEEAELCIRLRLDAPEIIEAQVSRYLGAHYPRNMGLVEASVILRRHTAAMAQFNRCWWEEICRGSRRDQISFSYAASCSKINYTRLPQTVRRNLWFIRHAHMKLPSPEVASPAP